MPQIFETQVVLVYGNAPFTSIRESAKSVDELTLIGGKASPPRRHRASPELSEADVRAE